jgi:ribosomal protein S21
MNSQDGRTDQPHEARLGQPHGEARSGQPYTTLGLFGGGVVVSGGDINMALVRLQRSVNSSRVNAELKLRSIPKPSERHRAKRRIAEDRRRRAEANRRNGESRYLRWQDRKGRRWLVPGPAPTPSPRVYAETLQAVGPQ